MQHLVPFVDVLQELGLIDNINLTSSGLLFVMFEWSEEGRSQGAHHPLPGGNCSKRNLAKVRAIAYDIIEQL